ncbi:activator-dependent family glycosyltransferase [Rhodococcus qingshengii]|uniref:activator-dependent family glycosyltransferase n=1 Tax=Rhodococcus qingshengii TaxID=334542 RepID=UPI0036D85D9C
MRVLFATYSERTHFHAMVPLAWALAGAGHEVRVASQPALTETIVASGLTAVPVGADHNLWRIANRFLTPRMARRDPAVYQRARAVDLPPFDTAELEPDEIDWDYMRSGYEHAVARWYRVVNDPMVDDLVAFAREWRPDLVLWEQATYAGPIAAAAVGAPHVRMPWCLDIFGRTRTNFRTMRDSRPEWDRSDPLADWLRAHAQRLHVDSADQTVEDMTVGHATIDQYPVPLQLDAGLNCLPMQYVPYNGPAVVPSWLRDPPSRPRVCVSLGVSATSRFGGYPVEMGDLLRALGDLDVEIIATVADNQQGGLGAVPSNTRIVSFVPLAALMPTCSAAVNHGAFGTVNTTLRYGVPQLTIPEQHDNPPVCRRIVSYGAGLTIPYTQVSADGVYAAVHSLLTESSFPESATRLRESMLAMPTPQQTVAALEQISGAAA